MEEDAQEAGTTSNISPVGPTEAIHIAIDPPCVPEATVGTYDGRRPQLHATTVQLPLQSKAVKAKLIPLPLCSLLIHEMKRYAGLFIEIIRY